MPQSIGTQLLHRNPFRSRNVAESAHCEGWVVGAVEGVAVLEVLDAGSQSPQEKRHAAVANWACQSTLDVQ